jgi:hypothetical protein
MNFKDIASVAGKPGLYKIIKPTRSGVILEALDEKKSKLVAGMSMRVSVLSDISIYTLTEEGAEPLESVMKKIEATYKGDTGVDATASDAELRAFLKSVLPEFDQDRTSKNSTPGTSLSTKTARKYFRKALLPKKKHNLQPRTYGAFFYLDL